MILLYVLGSLLIFSVYCFCILSNVIMKCLLGITHFFPSYFLLNGFLMGFVYCVCVIDMHIIVFMAK